MKKIKVCFLCLNILLIAATGVGCLCYHAHGGLLIKGMTASGFVLIGWVNLVYAQKSRCRRMQFPIRMAVGLLLCMMGDIVLNRNFLLGAVIFAAGHGAYIAAYASLRKGMRREWMLNAGIALASVLLVISPFFSFHAWMMKGVCILYAMVISCMMGKAISLWRMNKDAVSGLIALGSVLFYFSDLMLAMHYFGNAPRIADTLCLFTYFPAQCLLAHAVFLFVIKENET